MKKLIIVATVILLLCVAYFHFVIGRKPLASTILVVPSCKKLEPGMRRMGDQYGFQFDVLVKDVTIIEGTSDTIPVVHGFDLKPKNGTSVLEISFGDKSMESMAVDSDRVFSDHIEQRSVFDDKRQLIGEDNWGYMKSGERWRKVQLRGGVVAKYGFINEKDAELFDQVINSVCRITASGS